ncbi:hypothetical protein MKX01_013418 [Papaver californicum]|nr:hypothetical protein MKX01_013418 [Papaver californicum]
MVHPIAEANAQSLFGSLSPTKFYSRHSVTHSSSYITNSRGLKLFTQSWTPLPPTKTKGIMAVIHGFTGESNWFIQLTDIHFAKSGFATCAIDHQGHGFSEGLQCHIPDINPVVDDCIDFFDSFREQHCQSLPSFLYGESLGGAIALLIHLRRGRPWDGIVLNGAMCGINPKYKPTWTPTLSVVPARRQIPNVSFKEEWKRRLATVSPQRTQAALRAATALKLLRVCREVQRRFGEVEVSLLIVHGGDDAVFDPACAEELHKKAASKDKTIKIYPENVDLVFDYIVEWLCERAERAAACNASGEASVSVA